MQRPALEQLRALQSGHNGAVILADDPGYDAARMLWNAMIDKRPAVIAQPTDARDVERCVVFARDHALPIAIRGGGHNVAGHALVDDGLVIDLRAMRSVRVDPERRRAWVQAGATLADVDQATQKHGLAAPLGIVSETGVAGLTLHGGFGYLRRKHGMACDAVRSFELVTATGERVRASETVNPDLFWGLKGAGANFGVVTEFEFELYPVGPEVVQLAVMYPIERVREYLPIWRDFMAKSPVDFVSNFLLWSMPDWDVLPETVRGRNVCVMGGCWTGDVAEGLEFIAPLRTLETPLADLSGAMSFLEVQTGFDPFFASGERCNYWKSAYVDRLDDDVIDFLATRAVDRPDPWTLIAIWHMGGGALSAVPADATAFGDRSTPYTISIDGGWADPAKTDASIAWVRALWSDLRKFSDSGGGYVNFAGFGEEGEALLRASYGDANYDRLRAIKGDWDPENTFKANMNIPPRRMT